MFGANNSISTPATYALMESRSAESYMRVLTAVKDLVGVAEPTLIISDFEAAIASAVRVVLPDAHHQGCFFHYAKAIIAKVKNTGHSALYRDDALLKSIVHYLIGLALVLRSIQYEGTASYNPPT